MNWRHWGGLLVLVLGWGFLAASRLPEAHAQRVAPAHSGELQSHVTTVNERLQVLTLIDPVSRQVCVYHLDTTTGIMTFTVPPTTGAVIRAGFEFDVPVRFDTDKLEINMHGFAHGAIPNIPVVEVRL